MRRIAPAYCSESLRRVLIEKQVKLDADMSEVDKMWKAFTKTVAYENLCDCLAEPLGLRRRCAYCSDSRAADVEHFWPKKPYPSMAFDFQNLLFICPECNRKKTSRFPLDGAGLPLLINPMFDDPWDSLFFIPSTGMIAPRIYTVVDGAPMRSARGEQTIAFFGEILNSDGLLSARRDSWLEIVSQLRDTLESTDPLPACQYDLFGDRDVFGLGEFLLNREGKEDPTVRALRQESPERWSALRDKQRFPPRASAE